MTKEYEIKYHTPDGRTEYKVVEGDDYETWAEPIPRLVVLQEDDAVYELVGYNFSVTSPEANTDGE